MSRNPVENTFLKIKSRTHRQGCQPAAYNHVTCSGIGEMEFNPFQFVDFYIGDTPDIRMDRKGFAICSESCLHSNRCCKIVRKSLDLRDVWDCRFQIQLMGLGPFRPGITNGEVPTADAITVSSTILRCPVNRMDAICIGSGIDIKVASRTAAVGIAR